MADSSARKSDRVFSCTVYSGGKPVGEAYRLTEAWVHLEVNRIGKARLCFEAGDMAGQSFPETDAATFKPGAEIRLDLGTPGEEATVFIGTVVMLNIEIREGTRSEMVVECRDALFPATLGRKNKIFEKQKDQEIIRTVLGAYGSVEVDATSYKHPSLVQYYCSDWDFALSRADACGLLVTCVKGKIQVKKPQVRGAAVVTVTYGADLIDFRGGLSAAGQFGEVEAVAWDPAKQTLAETKASKPSLNQQGNTREADWKTGETFLLQTDIPSGDKGLKNWADSVALRAGLARYRGSFSFYGQAAVVPGCIVELKGLGDRFDGDVFVGAVEHIVEDQRWTTRVEMGVPPGRITEEPDVVAPPAAGYLPGIAGLHIGKVKKLEEDPEKEFRILVEIPLLKGSQGLWARLATDYAGKERGMFFMPEKGDEVVVGFFNQDPRYPVILGSLYSSKLSPAYSLTADNDKKAWVTREKLKIEFDEKKKIITLLTPGKNCVELNDDGKAIRLTDANKNEIVMNQSGITIKSAGKIELKAKTECSVDAGSDVGLSAKNGLKAKALNIEMKANVGFKAQGTATAELSASGQTTVKGAMVMIN